MEQTTEITAAVAMDQSGAGSALSEAEVRTSMEAATREVFATMLGIEVTAGESRKEAAEPRPQDGVVALIGLAGNWAGTGMIRSKGETACAISGLLLMQDFAGVDDEVLDAVGEIANMIFGNIKTGLEERLGPMGLSIPTVIFGRNFSTRSIGRSEWTVIPFTWDRYQLEVYLCLSPAQKPAPGTRLGPILSLAG